MTLQRAEWHITAQGPGRASRRRTLRAPASLLLVLVCLFGRAEAQSLDCETLRADLDASLATAHAMDVRYHRRAHARWLRTDRFLAGELARTPDAHGRRVILEAMADLDRIALTRELDRLAATAPEAARMDEQVLQQCRLAELLNLTRTPARIDALAAEAPPDDYSTTQRLFGGYAFARPFLRAGAARWRRLEAAAIAGTRPDPALLYTPEQRLAADDHARVESAGNGPAADARSRESGVGPPGVGPPGTHDSAAHDREADTTDVGALATAHALADARRAHPLAWPELDEATLETIASRHAPEIAVQADVRHGRIGSLEGTPDGPRVATGRPEAYVDRHLTRWGEQVLLQISYTFWFIERPRSGPLDPYGGAVDGIVWRVTLGDDGRALLWESIHPCGCYYTVVLPADRILRIDAVDEARLEPPMYLQGPASAMRPRLHLTAAEHYLRAVTEAGARAPGARTGSYALTPYAGLLGGRDAAPRFDAHGILRGTSRGERWFLWPSGVRDPGAMRSNGHHATAFLGKRHFERHLLLGGRLRAVTHP